MHLKIQKKAKELLLESGKPFTWFRYASEVNGKYVMLPGKAIHREALIKVVDILVKQYPDIPRSKIQDIVVKLVNT